MNFGKQIYASGTTRIKTFSNHIYGLTNFNGHVYFLHPNCIHGEELWRTDGTLTGTIMLKDINYGKNSSHPLSFTIFNNELYHMI